MTSDIGRLCPICIPIPALHITLPAVTSPLSSALVASMTVIVVVYDFPFTPGGFFSGFLTGYADGRGGSGFLAGYVDGVGM